MTRISERNRYTSVKNIYCDGIWEGNVMISYIFDLVVRKVGYRKTAMPSDSPEFEFEFVKCRRLESGMLSIFLFV